MSGRPRIGRAGPRRSIDSTLIYMLIPSDTDAYLGLMAKDPLSDLAGDLEWR